MFTKNKKGVHVDWAISMGIFLIYIIGMFVLLRPGVTPVHKPAGLLEILESNFVKEVMYEVREVPLVIELCYAEPPAEEKIVTVEDTSDNFGIGRIENEKGESEDPIKCGVKGSETVIVDKTYLITYYQKYSKEITSNLEIKCFGDEGCEMILGASTSKEGINEGWLNTLKEYDELKSDWNFPDDKEFAIYKFSGDDLVLVNGAEKEQGINIFTKEIKTNMLSNSGTLDPVTISLQVW